MGALTSLLVLASLLASIEENLPKTSYFKKIDIWFMSYIIFIFVIICFHICVDFCAGSNRKKWHYFVVNPLQIQTTVSNKPKDMEKSL